jgi:hypothetical protein
MEKMVRMTSSTDRAVEEEEKKKDRSTRVIGINVSSGSLVQVHVQYMPQGNHGS